MRGFWLALLSVIAAGPARADWVADAWPEASIPTIENPAITFIITRPAPLPWCYPRPYLGKLKPRD